MRLVTRPCHMQMLLQSVLQPGSSVSTGALSVGVPALLAALGGAMEGATAANPGQPQVRLTARDVEDRT